MIASMLLAGSLILAAATSTPGEAASCVHDRDAMFAKDFEAFDQKPDGWRSIGQLDGCEGAAADLIAEYKRVNAARLTAGHLRRLAWHEGQLRAANGQTDQAVVLFQAADQGDPFPDNRVYHAATIAFMNGDLPGLLAARGQLAALPPPDDWAEVMDGFEEKYGQKPPTWPMNLDVIDGLIACFGRPYKEAYGMACRPAARRP